MRLSLRFAATALLAFGTALPATAQDLSFTSFASYADIEVDLGGPSLETEAAGLRLLAEGDHDSGLSYTLDGLVADVEGLSLSAASFDAAWYIGGGLFGPAASYSYADTLLGDDDMVLGGVAARGALADFGVEGRILTDGDGIYQGGFDISQEIAPGTFVLAEYTRYEYDTDGIEYEVDSGELGLRFPISGNIHGDTRFTYATDGDATIRAISAGIGVTF